MNDETYKFDPNDIRATNSLAWLSYLGIFFLIPMLVNKNSPFTKFHVNQGIVLLIALIIANVVGAIAAFIPFIGWIVYPLLSVAMFVLAILGIVNAAQGKAKRLPIIGNIEIYK